MSSSSTALPTYFIAHGGGPMPLLGDASHAALIEHWKKLSKKIEQPKAILVVSAHWEAGVPTITSAHTPSLLYDYYGFPPESYEIKYACPGEPALAQRVQGLLGAAGFAANLDGKRGLDHGVFVPLKLLFPDASIPVIQLSLLQSLDARKHVEMGRALAPLRHEGVLILGSGFNFHNMRAFFSPSGDGARWSKAFNAFLIEACTAHVGEERDAKLAAWAKAPYARECHPREEHLLPLLVVAAAAGQSPATTLFQASTLNVETLDFKFADPATCA